MAQRSLWAVGAFLLAVAAVLGSLRPELENTAEALGGGLGTALGGLAIAAAGRALWWLAKRRIPAFWTPWLLVAGGLIGILGALGSTAGEIEESAAAPTHRFVDAEP